ncbi:IS21-like element helper ATPase IstB [Pseudoalteromonas sp. RB2-MNA-CIBAN-0110]|uniref:IS21-like element helper ATPase IstB n=1 Tax=Pseudoalteromonas sp. RB2-MNA-CIBAN-0110 TaxID=3140439 RepID=UPI003316E344
MLLQQTIEHLNTLKLYGMTAELQRQLNSPDTLRLVFDERLALLSDAEINDREARRQNRARKAAKLTLTHACVEDINFQASRGLDREQVKSLFDCEWLTRSQHILLTGLTGVGKSYIACAFAQQAMRKGYAVLFYRTPRLLEDMEIARLDGSLPKFRMRLLKFKLLILDDWALVPLNDYGKQDLLEIIEDRTGKGSLIITSQLPVEKWHEYIGEPTFADAIMDRIIHRAHKISMHGQSMRKEFDPTTGVHCDGE